MILTLLLLVQAAAVSPAPAPESDEVVVIGQRLKTWTGRVNDTLGVRTCRTVRSTGDAEIDRIGCRALTECFVGVRTETNAAVKAAGKDQAARAAAVAPINQRVGQCLKARRDTLVAELAARRVADRKPT